MARWLKWLPTNKSPSSITTVPVPSRSSLIKSFLRRRDEHNDSALFSPPLSLLICKNGKHGEVSNSISHLASQILSAQLSVSYSQSPSVSSYLFVAVVIVEIDVKILLLAVATREMKID